MGEERRLQAQEETRRRRKRRRGQEGVEGSTAFSHPALDVKPHSAALLDGRPCCLCSLMSW